MSSTLFARPAFEGFANDRAGTSLVDQWGSCVAKVGGKAFLLLGDAGDRITFKCPEESFELLTMIEGIDQAAYFAKRKWVTISDSAEFSDADLRAYAQRSYELVAAGLTRKLRDELGIKIAN